MDRADSHGPDLQAGLAAEGAGILKKGRLGHWGGVEAG